MNKQENEKKPYVPQRRTSPELAKDFNVSERTMRRMTFNIKDKLGPRKGHYHSPEQVEVVVNHYGRPWFLLPLVWLFLLPAALLMLMDNIMDLAHSYNSNMPYSGNNTFRRIRAISLITVGTSAFVAGGYYLGLVIF
jgi:hypothetical protein